MAATARLPVVAFTVLLCALGTSAVHVVKKVKGDDLVFITKFCFSEGQGTLKGRVYAESNNGDAKFLLFSDEDSSWNRQANMGCEDKTKAAKMTVDIEEGINFNFDVQIKDEDGPHFWYVAAVDCKAPVDMDVDLKLWNAGNGWAKEFSNDEKELMIVYLVMTCIVTAIFISQFKSARRVLATADLHPIVKIVTSAVVLEMVSLLLHTLHYIIFAFNGTGWPAIQLVGDLAYCFFQVVMVCIICILAKGWTISKVDIDDRKSLVLGLAVYFALQLALFLWTYLIQFQISTVYKYGTVPGIMIAAVRVGIWGWFTLNLFRTLGEEEDDTKRGLYKMLYALFSAWLLSLLAIVMIASSVEPCLRKALVTSILLVTDIMNLGSLAFLLSPSRASEYFHIDYKEYSPISQSSKKDDDL